MPRCVLILALLLSTGVQAADVVEGAWYDSSSPVPVMHLEGSIEDVARLHGLFVARYPHGKETVQFLSEIVDHRLKTNPQLASHPLVRAGISWLYRKFIRNPMIDHVPERYRNAYAAFAKASGIDEDDVLDALVLPDAALRTVSLLYKTELGPLLPANFGCTSIIWDSGPNNVLHGRNLDYDGVGYWEKNPVIMHVVPNEGLAYVAVTALGVHSPGITAFNEAGLTLAIHQLTFDDTQASGTPLPVISAEVIRNARTIDDAINIIRGFPRAGGWAYVLSHGSDRAVVETSANELAVRRSSEHFFYQTNHVSSPALEKHQIFYTPGSWLDSFERAETLKRFATSGGSKGWATADRIAPLLGSHSVGGRSRVAGGTIAKLDNIQSVVMDAAHRRLWIAVGSNDRAPNENKYVEYKWWDLRSADAPEVTEDEIQLSAAPMSKLRALLRKGADQSAPDMEKARTELLKSYLAGVGENAVGYWPGSFLYVWQGLRSGATSPAAAEGLLKEIDHALDDPDLATTLNTDVGSRHRLSLARLFRGRLLDLLGRRGDALYEYYAAKRLAPFERVRKAADKNIRSRYQWSQARNVAIDWAGIDLFQY